MSKENKEKKPIPRLLKYLLCLIAAGVLGLIIAGIQYFGTDNIQRSSSVVLEFTYDGASKNLTPAGKKFSIDSITGDTVLEAALANAGLSDKYTVEAIRKSIVVSGSYPADVIARIKSYSSLYDFSSSREVSLNDYYPTIYSLVLYDDFDPNASADTMNKLVKAIAESYKTYFLSEYVYAFDMSSFNSIIITDNYDYSQRIKILRHRLDLIEKYSAEMYANNTAFKYNGLSFNDINLAGTDIERDMLSKLEAMVMINAYTVSSSRLRNQYEYEIRLLENELEFKKSNLEDLNRLIESYQIDDEMYIGSGDSLVTIESNSTETYETLIDEKREITERIVEINSLISEYKLNISDLDNAQVNPSSNKSDAESQFVSIINNINRLEESFKELQKAYNDSVVSNDSILIESVRFNSAKLLSSGFIVKVIKCAGPFCVIVLVICCLHAAVFEIRKFRKEAKEAEA